MKEVQAGIQLVQANCIQLNQHPLFQKKASKSEESGIQRRQASQQKQLVPFPAKSPLEMLRQRTNEGLKRLHTQAERINQLSAELEAAVLELKAIASDVNRDWRAIQGTHAAATGGIDKQNAIASFSSDVCEYCATHVPTIQQKQSGAFVVTSRPVDLFKAEREAALLAQTLRRRAKRKQPKSE